MRRWLPAWSTFSPSRANPLYFMGRTPEERLMKITDDIWKLINLYHVLNKVIEEIANPIKEITWDKDNNILSFLMDNGEVNNITLTNLTHDVIETDEQFIFENLTGKIYIKKKYIDTFTHDNTNSLLVIHDIYGNNIKADISKIAKNTTEDEDFIYFNNGDGTQLKHSKAVNDNQSIIDYSRYVEQIYSTENVEELIKFKDEDKQKYQIIDNAFIFKENGVFNVRLTLDVVAETSEEVEFTFYNRIKKLDVVNYSLKSGRNFINVQFTDFFFEADIPTTFTFTASSKLTIKNTHIIFEYVSDDVRNPFACVGIPIYTKEDFENIPENTTDTYCLMNDITVEYSLKNFSGELHGNFNTLTFTSDSNVFLKGGSNALIKNLKIETNGVLYVFSDSLIRDCNNIMLENMIFNTKNRSIFKNVNTATLINVNANVKSFADIVTNFTQIIASKISFTAHLFKESNSYGVLSIDYSSLISNYTENYEVAKDYIFIESNDLKISINNSYLECTLNNNVAVSPFMTLNELKIQNSYLNFTAKRSTTSEEPADNLCGVATNIGVFRNNILIFDGYSGSSKLLTIGNLDTNNINADNSIENNLIFATSKGCVLGNLVNKPLTTNNFLTPTTTFLNIDNTPFNTNFTGTYVTHEIMSDINNWILVNYNDTDWNLTDRLNEGYLPTVRGVREQDKVLITST